METGAAMKRSRDRSPEAIEFAGDQRARANEFVQTVWRSVRNRQICHQKFRREYPVSPYTADFCCVELKLILEVDGADHLTDAGKEYDRVRDEALAGQGYLVVRISGYDVLREPGRTLERIEECVRERRRELGMGTK
jgi:very-short-patch-repair endonuclease